MWRNVRVKYRTLGKSGLMVSEICLGTMTFGDPVDENTASYIVDGAIDLGINFIDTANCYEGYNRGAETSGGQGEEVLGKALKGKRDKVILATKVGAPVGRGHQERGLSATHIIRELDKSLQRLKTDYIDLYIIHWPDKMVAREETLRAINTAVSQGKIGYFGVSNHSAWQACEFLWIADKRNWPSLVSSQIPFSMLQRNYQADLQFYEEHDIAVTPYQALQGGLLTGKYKRDENAPKGSRAEEKPSWLWKLDEEGFNKLERIEALANSIGVSMTQYSLAWALQIKAVKSLVLGVKRLDQIEDCIKALDVKIPEEHLSKIDEIIPPPILTQYKRIRG